jgi:hypothetical protein
MAYPPKAKALLGRDHKQEHLELLAGLTSAVYANSGLSEDEIARGSVALAIEIQKRVKDHIDSQG